MAKARTGGGGAGGGGLGGGLGDGGGGLGGSGLGGGGLGGGGDGGGGLGGGGDGGGGLGGGDGLGGGLGGGGDGGGGLGGGGLGGAMTKSQGPITATKLMPFGSRTVIFVSLKWPDTVGVPDRKHLQPPRERNRQCLRQGTHERLSDSPAGRSTTSPGSCLSQATCEYSAPVPVCEALPKSRSTTWIWYATTDVDATRPPNRAGHMLVEGGTGGEGARVSRKSRKRNARVRRSPVQSTPEKPLVHVHVGNNPTAEHVQLESKKKMDCWPAFAWPASNTQLTDPIWLCCKRRPVGAAAPPAMVSMISASVNVVPCGAPNTCASSRSTAASTCAGGSEATDELENVCRVLARMSALYF